MNTQRRKPTVVDVVYRLLSIAVLAFIIYKCHGAQNLAKTQLLQVEPIWESGTAVAGRMTADGEITRTRIFFKAQEVLLEYDVDGEPTSSRVRMMMKDIKKIDGSDKDGKGDVMLRYDPVEPERAATEQSVKILKQEVNAFQGVKWLCVFYLFLDALVLIRIILWGLEAAKERKAIRKKREEAERIAREAIARQNKPAAGPKNDWDMILNQAEAEAKQRHGQGGQEKKPNGWDEVLQGAEAEANKRRNSASNKSNDWSAELNNAASEARKRRQGESGRTGTNKPVIDVAATVIDKDSASSAGSDVSGGKPPKSVDDATVYDGTVGNETVYDGTVYDTGAPSSEDGTVYDGNDNIGTVYDAGTPSPEDGTVYDETVYDAGVPSPEEGTVYDGTVIDGTVYDGTVIDETVYDTGGRNTGNNNGSVRGGDPYGRGSMVLETYRIDSDAILGGMGSVWKVRHTGWDVDLAMKRPKPAYFKTDRQKQDFTAECESWINLGIHPNIVACYYVREVDGVPSIFSEWMDKGNLAESIRDGSLYKGSQAVVEGRLLDIAIQFAEGLHFAHSAKLIHQDVKPANLLLTGDWEARVADFGIARAGVRAGGGNIMTPAYCSPEQAAGKKLSRKTDIYSWAVSVLEMYLGYRPWQHGTLVGEACHEYFEMARIRIPDRLRDILSSCLAVETRDRPRDFASVIRDLKAVYKDVTGNAYPRPTSKPSPDSGDNLNNRALSYLDLGKEAEAQKLWNKAALLEPSHTETLFNRCLYGYRNKSMSLYEAQCFLSANWENHFNEAMPGLLLAELSLEGNDKVNARDVLSYVRNYSTQQEQLSEEALSKLAALEAALDSGSWQCAYRLNRVKNYKEQEKLIKARDQKLRDLKNLVKKNKYDEAATQLMMTHLSRELGDALYQEDWMAFYDELSRKCMPAVVLAQWPVLTASTPRWNGRVSFSDDSSLMLCGEKLIDLKTGQVIRDNGIGQENTKVCLSGLSPDGSFYLVAPYNSNRFVKVEARTGRNLVFCGGHEQKITALAISRDGRYLASGDSGGTLKIWDADGNLLRTQTLLSGESEALEDIQFGYDSRKMVLRLENTVYLDDGVNKSIRRIPYDNYLEVAVDLEYTALGMAAGRQGLHCLDMKTNKDRKLDDEDAVRRRGQGISTAARVCFMHNQRFLLVSDSRMIYFFDLATNKILSAIHTEDYLTGIASSRDGKYIAAVSGGQVQVWRCIYGFRYPWTGKGATADIVGPCAFVQRSAHPDKKPEELLDSLMNELADRGYGGVDREKALQALKEAEI